MDEYEWKRQYLERLADLGLSQTEAVSTMQHRFGRRPIDTENCPRCAANAELHEYEQLDRDELARLRAQMEMCQKHGDALQRIGTALGLSSGDDLH